jgi:hypothetical protein
VPVYTRGLLGGVEGEESESGLEETADEPSLSLTPLSPGAGVSARYSRVRGSLPVGITFLVTFT